MDGFWGEMTKIRHVCRSSIFCTPYAKRQQFLCATSKSSQVVMSRNGPQALAGDATGGLPGYTTPDSSTPRPVDRKWREMSTKMFHDQRLRATTYFSIPVVSLPSSAQTNRGLPVYRLSVSLNRGTHGAAPCCARSLVYPHGLHGTAGPRVASCWTGTAMTTGMSRVMACCCGTTEVAFPANGIPCLLYFSSI